MISPATHDVLFCYWVQWFSGLYQAQCGKDDVLVVTGHFTGDHVLFHLDTVFFLPVPYSSLQPWVIQVIIPARNARTARRPEFTWVPPHCDTVATVS